MISILFSPVHYYECRPVVNIVKYVINMFCYVKYIKFQLPKESEAFPLTLFES